MKIKSKGILAIVIFLLFFSVFPAYAASKINTVSLEFNIEEYDENGFPEITADTLSSHYSCGEVSLKLEDEDSSSSKKKADSTSASEQIYEVELSASEGYAFYITKASQIKLKGAGAEYIKASRLHKGTTLIIEVKFAKLEDICTPISEAQWVGDGRAEWESSINATHYKLILTRNSSSKVYYTGGTTYDFRPLMLREGFYSLQVQPLSISNYLAEGADAGSYYVSKEQAEAYREAFKVETEQHQLEGTEGQTGPGTVEVVYKNTGWKQDDRGWWYQNNDGSYLQYDWILSNGKWYFFDSDGYMVTDKVVKWGNNRYYLDKNGRMVVNRRVPDGRTAGADGVLTGEMSKGYIEQAIANGSLEMDPSYYGPGVVGKTATVNKTTSGKAIIAGQ